MTFPINAFRRESMAIVKLTLSDGNGRSASATGFYIKFGNSVYLVTAKHALLGASGFSDDALARRKWIPKYLNCNCFRICGEILENYSVNEHLYDASNNQRWIENPNWDIAVIDLTSVLLDNGFSPITIDMSQVMVSLDENGEAKWVSADLDLPAVAEEIFVVGYPKGLSILREGSFPIWKRGSIATEPHMDINGEPIFLIDTLGREGLSGAPVLYRGDKLISPLGSWRTRGESPGAFRVVGIYVGREGITEGDHLSLGRVYKRSAIQDTIFYRNSDGE